MGSGLGLILVKDFVTRQGGKLSVESEIDKGTSISFTVPAYL
jgi:signal transduction histidine kinase